MSEEVDSQRGLLFRPFLLLAVVVALTALIGLFYLLGVVLLKQPTPKASSPSAPTSPKIWVSKELTVCDEVWQEKGIDLEKYLSSLGIEVFGKITKPSLNQKVDTACKKCACLKGEVLYLNVNKEALVDLVGFVESGPPQGKND